MSVSGRSAVAGGVCGLVAGIVSGAILQVIWALQPFALLLARRPATGPGWVVYLVLTVLTGVIFGIVAGAMKLSARGLLVGGIITGIVLFLVVPVWLLPAVAGTRPESPLHMKWLRVVAAYLVYGAVLGAVYRPLGDKVLERRV